MALSITRGSFLYNSDMLCYMFTRHAYKVIKVAMLLLCDTKLAIQNILLNDVTDIITCIHGKCNYMYMID